MYLDEITKIQIMTVNLEIYYEVKSRSNDELYD
jgi:hypothetical protein